MNLFFSNAARENIQETNPDIDQDYDAIFTGHVSPGELLDHCLAGADADRRQGWLDYVNEISRAAMAQEGRTHEHLCLPEAS